MEFTGKNAWRDACSYMSQFNKDLGIDSKSWSPGDPICVMVAVISQESFSKEYTEEERSYRFNNYNKAFLPMTSRSIFSDCLDGKDLGVRLDVYVHGGDDSWKVERVYIETEQRVASS